MDTVYPATASALARGRRLRRAGAQSRLRHRTLPVTFAEIKEVDEESEEVAECSERRQPDVLEERLDRQLSEARRRRALRPARPRALPERDHECAPPDHAPALARAGSEPAQLHHRDTEPEPRVPPATSARDT